MSKAKTEVTIELIEESLRNIELNELILSNICLKVARISRLVNDLENMSLFSEYASAIGKLETQKKTLELFLQSSQDPNISITSANPNQYLNLPRGNSSDRGDAVKIIIDTEELIQTKKAIVYKCLINKYYQLRFSEIPQRIFERTKSKVENKLKDLIPDSIKQFVSIYDNLNSDNQEDWSNAVHSCRRILQALADKCYSPNHDGKTEIEKDSKKIKVGVENYINRLVLFIESKPTSQNFQNIVGSHLEYLGNRIDAVYNASSKGSHTVITNREEAERYIIFTYLLVGDVLELT
ncbi:MAG: hypothetical protein FD122_2768 [Stygiobacter sp.]|nr:MAG: hypothetical protein FD122_2768 [Stygiobacter sp.]KAF0214273.1 MAG: hypothetical protein FD178_2540 [Ignavibacteria bacterium]